MWEYVGYSVSIVDFDKVYVRLYSIVEAVDIDEVDGLCFVIFKSGYFESSWVCV